MLDIKLPFYGKRGSIGKIIETPSNYQVYTYNIDGKKYDQIRNIKKNSQNKNDLLNSFYQDVEEYLIKNNDKFKQLSTQEKKNILDKKIVQIILIASVALGILPLATSIILESVNLWNIGIITLLTGASFATASLISLKNIKEKEETEQFLKTYSNLQHELKLYKEEKSKSVALNKKIEKPNHRSLSPMMQSKIGKNIKTKTKAPETDTSQKVA